MRPGFGTYRFGLRNADLLAQGNRIHTLQAAGVGRRGEGRANQNIDEALGVFALQIAAQRTNIAAGLEFTPNCVGQIRVELGEFERGGGIVELFGAIENSRGDAVAQKLIQHVTLNGQHFRAERKNGRTGHLANTGIIAAVKVINRQASRRG